MAYVLDFLAIVTADVAGISERRTDRFLDVSTQSRSDPLPRRRPRCRQRTDDRAVHTSCHRVRTQATREPGQCSNSIPSSAMQEDHVSMGWSGARKLRRSIDGLTPSSRDRDTDCSTRNRFAAPHSSPPPPPGAVLRTLREKGAGAGVPIASCPPRSRPRWTWRHRVPLVAAAENAIGGPGMTAPGALEASPPTPKSKHSLDTPKPPASSRFGGGRRATSRRLHPRRPFSRPSISRPHTRTCIRRCSATR